MAILMKEEKDNIMNYKKQRITLTCGFQDVLSIVFSIQICSQIHIFSLSYFTGSLHKFGI
jgi:hypothetical protein